MSSFSVDEGHLGHQETLRLTGPGTSAEIARHGATLLRWNATVGGEPSGELIDGYATEEELRSHVGVRCGVMSPFSNRIRDARYSFDGERHDLLPGVPDGEERLFYHGFVHLVDCAVLATEATDTQAHVRLGTQEIRPGTFPGYPFAVDVEIAYTLTARGLTLEIVGRNVGDRPAPYGCGWHPYFRVGGPEVDHLELHIPADTAIRTDDALIPLDGDEAHQPVENDERPTYRTPAPVGDAVIDAAYGDLVPDADGVVRTRVRNPATGLTLTVRQRSGLMHVFTGDTLDREPRTSIALEPVELMTNAFNRPDCHDAIVLEPGAERRFVCGVEVDRS